MRPHLVVQAVKHNAHNTEPREALIPRIRSTGTRYGFSPHAKKSAGAMPRCSLVFRLQLSLREIEELLLEHGVTISYETRRSEKAIGKSRASETVTADKNGSNLAALQAVMLNGERRSRSGNASI